MINLDPIWLSLKLALLTFALLLVIGVPVAYGLSRWKSKFKLVVESLVSLPIILPPTVIGFYLLISFAPDSAVGQFLGATGLQIPFTFLGILIASLIYSFPFMVQPIQRAFEQLPEQYWNISYSLGKSRWQTLWSVILPNIKYSIITGIVLTFAHTMGEFGVILMIGGNIPGVTRVASLAIYSEIEALNYGAAHTYSLILLLISLVVIVVLNLLNSKVRTN